MEWGSGAVRSIGVQSALSREVLMSVRLAVFVLVASLAGIARPSAQIPQGVFTEAFPPEEFAGRRERVFEAIGDGVAILQGAVEKSAELAFRQNTQFFYLTGVE